MRRRSTPRAPRCWPGSHPWAEAGVLGAVLLQFPWSFRYGAENAAYLGAIAWRLNAFPLVVEVRHESWNRRDFLELLRELRIAFCNLDQPVIGESIPLSAHVTAPLGYFRLHGRNYGTWFQEDAGRDARYDYLYEPREVEQITGYIHAVDEATDETYAITNNHFRGQAIATAIEILMRLGPEPPAIPPPVAAAFPHLVSSA
jgi:uncharacterized protein YecE (DUF72 family)